MRRPKKHNATQAEYNRLAALVSPEAPKIPRQELSMQELCEDFNNVPDRKTTKRGKKTKWNQRPMAVVNYGHDQLHPLPRHRLAEISVAHGAQTYRA